MSGSGPGSPNTMIPRNSRNYILAGNYQLLDRLYDDRDAAIMLLRELRDEQNGAPLETRRKHWEAVMARVDALLQMFNA